MVGPGGAHAARQAGRALAHLSRHLGRNGRNVVIDGRLGYKPRPPARNNAIMNAALEDISPASRWLARWVDLARRFALWVLLASVLSGAGTLVYAIEHLGINTSTKEMLSDTLPFRRNDRAMDRAFPQLEHQILVVVEASQSRAGRGRGDAPRRGPAYASRALQQRVLSRGR